MPEQGTRCPVTCWKGDPAHRMAGKARCRFMQGHVEEFHEDENGNRFDGEGNLRLIRRAA